MNTILRGRPNTPLELLLHIGRLIHCRYVSAYVSYGGRNSRPNASKLRRGLPLGYIFRPHSSNRQSEHLRCRKDDFALTSRRPSVCSLFVLKMTYSCSPMSTPCMYIVFFLSKSDCASVVNLLHISNCLRRFRAFRELRSSERRSKDFGNSCIPDCAPDVHRLYKVTGIIL